MNRAVTRSHISPAPSPISTRSDVDDVTTSVAGHVLLVGLIRYQPLVGDDDGSDEHFAISDHPMITSNGSPWLRISI